VPVGKLDYLGVWNSSDYTLIKRGQLRFTGLDVEMIDTGLAARATHRVAGTVVAPVAP